MTSMQSKKIHIKPLILLNILLFLISSPLFANRVGFNGYQDLSIDFPEEFNLTYSSRDGKTYQLQSAIQDVSCIITLINKGRYGSTARAMDETLRTYSLKGQNSVVQWRNSTSTLSTITGTNAGQNIYGIGVSADIPYDKGQIVFFTWCPESKKNECSFLMESLIDSLNIDGGSYYEPGVITKSKYPSSQTKNIQLKIDGKTINTQILATDEEAAQYVVEREYKVLCLYSRSQLWQDAWCRYYRMIYRDSFARLKRASFDIFNELWPLSTDETDLAQKLLSWTQSFSYEREKTASDFMCLPGILNGKGSDCDSRSLLLAVLLGAMNIDSQIMVSNTYSHAMSLIVSSHPGHTYSFEGKNYLMGETTATGLTWGKISSNMDNQNQWIFVQFP